MFVVNDDLSIYATRGDTVFFNVSADDHGNPYKFQPGDIVRMAIYGKKDAETCVMQKDFPVEEVTETVFIYLEEQDTKIGESISKHKDYWYEVVLNPDTIPQTIIGYDEDGAKIFRLFPESEEIDDNYDPKPEDFPVVDAELDLTSPRPVANSAVTRELLRISADNASVLHLNCFSEILAYKEKVSNSFICGTTIDFTDSISGLKDCYLRFDPRWPFVWNNKDSWETGYYDNGWKYNDKVALTLSGLENVTFDGLTFFADIDDPEILTWTGIRLENCKNVKFVNCNIQGFKWIGIDVSGNGNSDIQICDSLIRRCRFNIYNAGRNTRIDGNTITDDYETTKEFTANGGTWVSNNKKDSLYYDGILESGVNSILTNNHIYQVGQSGIYSSSCAGVKVLNNVCSDNYNGGIDFGALSPVDNVYAMDDVTISGNLCSGNKAMGFNVTNAKGFYLCGNKSINNGDACISVEGKSTECYFVSNYCLSAAKRGISFGLNVSHCVAIDTVGSCGDKLVAIPSDCAESVKDYPYNKVSAESVTIDVPVGSDEIASRTVIKANIDNSLPEQYWYANKPVDLRASEASGDFQKLHVGDFVAKNQITDSIWANNFIRLPQKTWTAAGAIWFNPETKKLQYYDGTNILTLATE